MYNWQKNMKQLTILFTLLLATFAGYAQSGAEVLRAVSEKVGAMGAYRIDFQLVMEAAEKPSEGYWVVDGERYLITIEDLKQGCDGATLWMYNGANREVTLDAPNHESRNLFDNPTVAFDFAEELFEVTSFEEASPEAWRIVLRPAEGVLEGVESVVLEVDRESMLPTRLGYDMAGVGLWINVVKIKPVTTTPSDFAVAAVSYTHLTLPTMAVV